MNYARTTGNQDPTSKLLWSALAFLGCGIPLWIWLLAYNLLGPVGFWQNLIVFGLGLWILGSVQVILLVVFVILLYLIWSD